MINTIIAIGKLNYLEQGITIPKTNLKKVEAFEHRPFGDGNDDVNTTLYWVHFKDFVLDNASSILESPGMVVQEYKLTGRLGGFDICDNVGDDVVMCLFSYEEVLIVLHSIMQNQKYRDGRVSIVYFMHENLLHCAFCRWDGAGWICDASPVFSYMWHVDDRVFGLATQA